MLFVIWVNWPLKRCNWATATSWFNTAQNYSASTMRRAFRNYIPSFASHPILCVLLLRACVCLCVCVSLCVCEFCLGWHPGPSCRSRANLRQAGYPQGTVEPEAASWPTTLNLPPPLDDTHTETHTQSPLYLTPKNSFTDLSNSPAPPLLNTHI